MKLKLKDLKPNPFKKWVNEGKLDDEQLEKLTSSIKELKMMGAFPVVKREGVYHLVSGHHRLAVMRKLYGSDHEVEVTLHDYDDDHLFRGMVNENLTQRKGEFKEEIENLQAIRHFLKSRAIFMDSINMVKRPQGGGRQEEAGSGREIADWLNKSGEVMPAPTIYELLRIKDNLDKTLYEEVEMTHKGTAERRGEILSKTQAVMLSAFKDKEEQKDLAKALKNSTEQRVREQSVKLAKYKDATDAVKKEIREGTTDLAKIDMAIWQDYKLTCGKDFLEKAHQPEAQAVMQATVTWDKLYGVMSKLSRDMSYFIETGYELLNVPTQEKARKFIEAHIKEMEEIKKCIKTKK
jgi:hypothetical protein